MIDHCILVGFLSQEHYPCRVLRFTFPKHRPSVYFVSLSPLQRSSSYHLTLVYHYVPEPTIPVLRCVRVVRMR